MRASRGQKGFQLADQHDNDIVLAAPVRTPIGKFGGVFSSLSAADLGTAAASGALERAGLDPARVDQVIFGHGRQAGGGPNTARQIAFRAGVPVERPAYTVNQACASGLQAVLSAARAILTGRGEGRPRRRHREHVEHPLLPPPRPLGLPDGERRDRRRHVPGRLQRSALEAGDGRDRRGAGGGDGDRPRRLRRLRPGEPAPLRAGPRRGPLRRARSCRSRSPGKKGETTVAHRRAPARRHDDRGDDQAPGRLPQGGRGHRRQRLGDHRRRGGDRRRLARRGPRAGPARGRPAGRLGGGRRRSADHGDRPGARRAQAVRARPGSTRARSTRWSSTRPSPPRCSPATRSSASTPPG